jgi:hypothetical protein
MYLTQLFKYLKVEERVESAQHVINARAPDVVKRGVEGVKAFVSDVKAILDEISVEE